MTRSDAELVADATGFMPNDVQSPPRTILTQDGAPAEVYVSPLLATAATADVFTDCDGNAVAPGGFFLALLDNADWSLGVGQCP